MNEFFHFVKCWFQLVNWQAFFNAPVHLITPVVKDFETVFKFTAVTPLESDAALLLACCMSDMFFYSIMEAGLGGAKLIVCTVASIFVYNIVWRHFSVPQSLGQLLMVCLNKKARILHPLRFLDDGFKSWPFEIFWAVEFCQKFMIRLNN